MPSKYGFMAKIGVDTSGVVKAVEDLERQLKNSKTELKYINESLKLDDGNNVAELGQKFETLTEIIKNTRTKLEQLKKSENDVQKAFESGKINESQYAKYKREVESTESSLKQYETQLRATEKQIEKAGRSTDGLKEDTKELKNEIGAAEKSAASFGDIFKANILSDVVSTGFERITDKFIEFARQGVELASSLSEVQNVVDVTFGNDANVINEWSKNAAESFGLSELAAKQYTGTLGAMLKSSGLAGDAVLQMSQDLTGLAGDLASFYNLDIGVAFEKIRSGISGETEPLKQLGIDMSVANMEAYALSQGIEKAWRNMSQAEKAQLRYSYLLQQTADAQGDFVRTSDSMANQQRIAELNFQNLSAELGKQLLPVLNEVMIALNEKLPEGEKHIERIGTAFANTVEFIVDNNEAILAAVGAFGAYKVGVKAITIAQAAFNVVASANPYVVIAGAATAAVAAILYFSDSEKRAADNAKQANEAYTQQAEKVDKLNSEYEKNKQKLKELSEIKVPSHAERQEIENLKSQNEQLEIQLALEKEILAVKQQESDRATAKALESPIEAYKNDLNEYKNSLEILKRLQADYDKAVQEGNEDNIQKYKQYIENINYTLEREREVLLLSADEAQELSKDLYGVTENGIEAQKTIQELNKELYNTLDLQTKQAENNKVLWYGGDIAAEQKKKYEEGQASYISALEKGKEKILEKEKEYTEELEKGLKELEAKYNTHGFMNADGTKDEKAYFAARKQYLEEHVNESSEIWWKYYDEITGYEKKSAEDAKAASEKAYEEAEKTRVETIKKSWDEITRQRQRGLITEEDEYKLKAQFVKEYCDESEDTWDEYYNWLYDYISDRESDITAEQVKAWESSSKALADKLSDKYEDLVKRKEKVRQELLNIDLAETVTDKDGKEVTVLTDLDAEIQKINKYTASLQKLKQTGATKSLIAEIQNLSYEDGQRQRYIDAILNLSEKSRQLYYNDWERAQQAAEKAAAQEVSKDLEKLNESTAQAVTDIFSGIPQSAYQQGIQTAQSYLQGIIDSMNGINQDLAIQGIMENAIGAGQQTNKQQEVIALSTPITINLNDKQYINTTIGDLMTQGVITGGNNFNL